MDRKQEEMQFVGLFGISKESVKLIHSHRKIFAQISLALIVPLAFVFLLHIGMSDVLFSKIITNGEAAGLDQSIGTPAYGKLSDVLAKDWTMFLLFNTAFFAFFLALSLLSTSAVVYTIACVYTGREVTFQKVLNAVPRVWRRLMVTFLCIFVAMFLYSAFSIALFIAFGMVVGNNIVGAVILLILGVLYMVGLVYMSVVWQLASVVSVLEEEYGFRAMAKSNDLIKGKIGLLVVVFLMLTFLLGFVQVLFKKLVVHGDSFGIPAKVGLGIICLALLSGLFLFGLTIRTMVYFVCKSYHHENIDKSALSDHLEVYLGGEYVPLRENDVQLEQCHV